MKQRSPSLLALMVVAVVALVLGSIGTAVAGPALTKGSVKKIAGKVVKKKAKTLSVAHATSADSATKLAGQPATAFQNNATVYTVNVTAPSTDIDIVVPLAVGKYLLSYSAFLPVADSATCYIYKEVGSTVTFVAEETTDAGTYDPGLSGTGYVEVVPTMVVHLYCEATSAFTTDLSEPIQIVVQQVDNAAVGNLTATRASGERGPRH